MMYTWKYEVPIRNSYIVDGSLNIYAGEYPGDKNGEKGEAKIIQMYNFGIRHFIDLTEEGELLPYNNLLPIDCTYTRFPIRDVDIPRSTEDVHKLIAQILEMSIRERGSVYIHCWGGVGRNGTIVACLLGELYRLPYDETQNKLEELFAVCPKSAYRDTPETAEQREFITRYIHKLRSNDITSQQK